MRKVLACLVVLCGLVSIAMTARYGWKQADNEVDQYMSAVMYGTIALCAIIFDGLAIRLWVSSWRKVGGMIGMIAGLAFIVTFSNSLGSITTRSDAVEAQRQTITDNRADDRKELARLEDTLGALPPYTPADDEAVEASKTAVTTADNRRSAECGTKNQQRGPHCKDREADLATATAALARTTANKAATDRARSIEAEIATVKARLGKSQNVGVVNPLAKALSQIIPWIDGNSIASRMQGVIALVFEMCIVGMMIGFEALGHVSRAATRREDMHQKPEKSSMTVAIRTAGEHESAPLEAEPVADEDRMIEPAKPQKLLEGSTPVAVNLLPRILTDHLERADGGKVEIAEIAGRYRKVCKADGHPTVSQDDFTHGLGKFCKEVGISTRSKGQKLYLLNVQLVSPITKS